MQPWRVGRKVPVNVYVGNRIAGQFQKEIWSRVAVDAVNARNDLELKLAEALARAEFAEDQRAVAIKDRDHAERQFAEAREALEPFARAHSILGRTDHDSIIVFSATGPDRRSVTITYGDLRRAAFTQNRG
jgi:hypothetical protein